MNSAPQTHLHAGEKAPGLAATVAMKGATERTEELSGGSEKLSNTSGA